MKTKLPIFSVGLQLNVLLSCAILVGLFVMVSTVNARANELAGPYSVQVYKTISESGYPGVVQEGVSFRLRKVSNIDPTTEEGQKQLSELDLRAAIRLPRIGVDRFERTVYKNGHAVASFMGLSAGVYVVEEQPFRRGDIAYSVTEPFVVSVPTDAFSDVVEIHTKHQPQILIKHADREVVSSSGTLRYALDANVPLPDANNRLHRFLFIDELVDGQELVGVNVHAYQAVSLSTSDAKFNDRSEPGVLLSHAVRVNGARVEVELDRIGLETLAQLRIHNPLITVRATLTVQTDDWYPERHVLVNKAYLYTDGRNPDSDPNFSQAVESNVVRVIVTRTRPNLEPLFEESDAGINSGSGNSNTIHAKNERLSLANTGSALTLFIGFGALLLFLGWRIIRSQRPGNSYTV